MPACTMFDVRCSRYGAHADDANFLDAIQYANREMQPYLTANDNGVFGAGGTDEEPTTLTPRERLSNIKIALKICDRPEIANLKKAMKPSVDAMNLRKRLEDTRRSRSSSQAKKRSSMGAMPAADAPTGFCDDSTRDSSKMVEDTRAATTDGVRDVLQATTVPDLRDTMRNLQSTMRDLCDVLRAQQRELIASDVTLTAAATRPPHVADKTFTVEATLARQQPATRAMGDSASSAANVETMPAGHS